MLLARTVAIMCYTALGAEFLYRLYKGKPIREASPTESEVSEKEFSGSKLEWRLQFMLFALAFSSLLLFIRAVYRTAEVRFGDLQLRVISVVLMRCSAQRRLEWLHYPHRSLLQRPRWWHGRTFYVHS